MPMTAWYRNEDWSDDIAADFEKRLARSRHQKAQNLSLQGRHLIAKRPDVARSLLERAIDLRDEFETPRALGGLALTCLALDDVDGALTAYEEALKWQLGQPNFIAVQPVDYLFLVGFFSRHDRLAAAESIADAMPDEGVFGPDPQIYAAKALVFGLAGRDSLARNYAVRALPLMEEMPDVAALGIDIGNLRRRLTTIAALER